MKVLSIIRKDLKMMLSDKKALAIILLMPIILMVILSFALKGIFMDDWEASKVNIAVVKQYDAAVDLKSFDDSLRNGLLAQGMGQGAAEELASTSDDTDPENIFFNEFLGSSEVSDIISYRIETEENANALLNNGEISAIVILPEKYLYNMKINLLTPFRNEVAIEVLTNPDASIDGQIVQSIMQAYSDSMSSVIIGKNVLIEAAMANNIGDNSIKGMETVMTGIMDALEAVQVEVNDVTLEGRKPISSSDYYAAAMLTMFILFSAGHGGRMLLEEKENSTYQRMMVAGTSKQGILAGKFLVVFIIALLQISIMTAFSSIVLKVEWGNFLSVALIGIVAAFAVAGVGATVAAATYRAGNYKMANIFETGIIQTMALLGGSFFPIDILPAVFQKLSFLSLNGIALKAYQKTMMGYGIDAVMGYIAVLAGIGAVFAVFAVVILRGKGEPAMLGIIKLRLLRLRDDFWVYVIMMIMAFGLTVVFGVSFDDYRPTVLIVDENKSSYSENLTEELGRNHAFAFVEANRIDAETQVREGKALAAVLIEDGFEAALKAGNPVPLGVMKLKDDTLLLTLEQQLSSAASKMTGGVRIAEITADYIAILQPMSDRESIKDTAYRNVMEAWEYKVPISVASTVVNTNAGSGYDNLKHSMIGFSLFFSMYTMVFGIGTILYDRQYKTWQRMMITPVSKASILGGSMIVTYLAGAIQLGILVLAGKYLLGIDWGSSIAGILLIVAAFIFAITTMGLLLSGLVKTHTQLASITPVLLTSTSMLGGCMWPLDIVNNKVLLFLAELTPQKWAIQGMEDIASKGMGFEAAVMPTLVLAVMGLIFFAAGVKLMKFE